MKAILIQTDGTHLEVSPENGKKFRLGEMYRLIGNDCSIVQLIELKNGLEMWTDEEGKLKDNMVNTDASALYYDKYPMAGNPNGISFDYIVGNVLLIDNTKAGKYL